MTKNNYHDDILTLILKIERAIDQTIHKENLSLSCHKHVTAKLQLIKIQTEHLREIQSNCKYVEDNPYCMGCNKEMPGWDFRNGWPYCQKCKDSYNGK